MDKCFFYPMKLTDGHKNGIKKGDSQQKGHLSDIYPCGNNNNK